MIDSLISLFYEQKCSFLNECIPPLYEEHKLRGVLLQYLYENQKDIKNVYSEIMRYIKWKKNNLPLQFKAGCLDLIVLFNSLREIFLVMEETLVLDL